MKFIHIADLHFGKNFDGYSMAEEDQPYWMDRFFELVDKENPDAIIIAGDVYDRGVPPKDAVNLLDEFLTRLSKKEIPILMIAGNHDSGSRLQFGSQLLEKSNLYIAGEIEANVKNVVLKDKYGTVTFWLVPYLFPALIQEVLDDKTITNYDQAMRALLQKQNIDFSIRNVIISHQMVTVGGKPLETEGSEVMVGGVGNIDVSAFDGFDYVALGHIHAAQTVGSDNVRYAGSPLCYHFSESKKNKKGPVIVTMEKKGKPLDIRVEELEVLHPLREIKGKYSEIISKETFNKKKNEYIKVTLTDNNVPSDAMRTLSDLFEKKGSKLMEMLHEPSIKYSDIESIKNKDVKKKSVSSLFEDFYRERFDGEFPSEIEKEIIDLIESQIESSNSDDLSEKEKQKNIDAIIELAQKETK